MIPALVIVFTVAIVLTTVCALASDPGAPFPIRSTIAAWIIVFALVAWRVLG